MITVLVACVAGSLVGAFVLASTGALAPTLQRGSWLARAKIGTK